MAAMIVSTAEMKRALQACAKVAESRPTIPILSYVKVETDDHGCRLSVTDREVSRMEVIEAAVAPGEEWAAAVHIKSLQKLLPKKVADIKRAPVVELNPGNDSEPTLVVVAGGGVSTLRTLPAEEFPTLPAPEASSEVTEPAVFRVNAWRGMIGKVFSAISSEESRFQLSGALFELGEVPVAVATDGHRLHKAVGTFRVRQPLEWPFTTESGKCRIAEEATLVPRALLACVQTDPAFADRKVKEQCGELKSGPNKGRPKYRTVHYPRDLYFSRSEHHIWIETPGVRYCSRILEGTFPDYGRVIKEDKPECEIIASAGDIRRAIAAVEGTVGDRARAVRLDLSGTFPVFSAKCPDKGASSAELNGSTELLGKLAKLDTEEEAKTSIGMNPDYLIDAFKPYHDEERVHVHLWDENTQAVVHVESDPSLRAVVMPIRL